MGGLAKHMRCSLGRGLGCTALAAGLLVGGAASADSQSCREWRHEHRGWKTESLRRYLRGAPQRDVDAAVFETLQREAWLTSCDVSVRIGRDELLGWRLVGRTPDEYGSAVAESVLDRAGFELELRELFAQPGPPIAKAPERRVQRRGVRPR